MGGETSLREGTRGGVQVGLLRTRKCAHSWLVVLILTRRRPRICERPRICGSFPASLSALPPLGIRRLARLACRDAVRSQRGTVWDARAVREAVAGREQPARPPSSALR